jgi:hypothetical protein
MEFKAIKTTPWICQFLLKAKLAKAFLSLKLEHQYSIVYNATRLGYKLKSLAM